MADAVAKLKDHRFAGSHTDLSKFPDGSRRRAVNVDLVKGVEFDENEAGRLVNGDVFRIEATDYPRGTARGGAELCRSCRKLRRCVVVSPVV